MADRTVKITVDANVSGLTAKMKAASGSVKNFASETNKQIHDSQGAINDLSGSFAKVGLGAVAAAGLAVKKFADFDQAMSGVQAATMETSGEMKKLRQAAIDAGADTQYSATESADAITELGKAGLKTADILGGGLSGALNLAASDQIDVATAASITASSLTQFNLKGKDATHVADLLAAGAGKANGGVIDLGQALNNVGGVASASGLSIEETTGFLAAMAEQGYVGAEAGTQFKSMLQALRGPSNEARKAMDELGISLYDQQGNTKSLTQFVGEYKAALTGKTEAEKAAYDTTIFGSYGINAAGVAYKNGAEGIQTWIDKVNDQGYAARQAAIRTDNLKGDIERLGGSLDTVLIQSGSGVNSTLRDIVQGAEGVVDALGKIPAPALSIGTALLGGSGVLALAVGGFMKLSTSIANTYAAFDIVHEKAPKVAKTLGRVGKSMAGIGGAAAGVLAAGAAAGALIDVFKEGDVAQGANALEKSVKALAASGDLSNINSQFQNWGTFLGASVNDVTDLGGALREALAPSVQDTMANLVGVLPGVTSYTEDVKNRFADLDATLSAMASGGSADEAAAAFKTITDAAKAQGFTVDQLKTLFPEYEDALVGVESAQSEAASATNDSTSALTKYTQSQQEGVPTTEEYTSALEEQIDTQLKAAGASLDARASERDYQQAVRDAEQALKDNGKTLDIHTEKGIANQEALDGIARATLDHVSDLKEQGASEDKIQRVMDRGRKKYAEVAAAMDGTSTSAEKARKKAKSLADQVGLIPSKVGVDVTIKDNSEKALDNLQKYILTANQVSHTNFTAPSSSSADRSGLTKPTSGPTSTVKRRATGGPITGPGTATSDSIPALLSNGEYVVNAAAYSKFGPLVEAINSGTIARYASGGYIGTPSATDSASIRTARLKAALRAANAEEKAAQKAYDAIDSSKANHAKKVAAKKDLADAKADAKSAKKAYDAAKSAVSTLRGYASDLASDKRLGSGIYAKADNPGDAISNALSNASSLLDWADSGAFSPAATDKMRKTAKSAQVRLTKAQDKLSAATDTLSDITSAYDSLRGSLTGGFSLSGMLGSKDAMGHPLATNARDIASSAQAYAGKLSSLATKVAALRKKGAHQALIEQITALDVDEALAVADQFLADSSSISATNSALDQIDSNANAVGFEVVKGMTDAKSLGQLSLVGGEISSSLVTALGKETDAIGSSIAVAITNAMAGKGSTAKKTTKKTAKKKALGGAVYGSEPYLVGEQGPELFVPNVSGQILTAPATSAAMSGTTISGAPIDYDRLAAAFARAVGELPVRGIPMPFSRQASAAVALDGAQELDRSGNRAWLSATGQKG